MYWQSMIHRTPNLGKIAMDFIWTRSISVDCEHLFLKYNNLLTDRREMLTEEYTKQILMLKFNGNLEDHMTL